MPRSSTAKKASIYSIWFDFSDKNDIDGFDPTAFVQELKQAIAETA